MSIGGGSSDSNNNPNNSGGETFGSSSQSSSSQSQSSSFRDPQFVWDPQAQYLQGLYAQGADVGARSGGYKRRADNLYRKAVRGFDNMMSAGVNPQLQQYSREVAKNLRRELLPSIRENAGQFGQLGGSRQGIAEGLAVDEANQNITDMAGNLYNADQNRRIQSMAMMPQLGMFGQQVPWFASNQMAGILGRPTVLGGAAGSQSTSSSHSSGGSESYGYNYDIGGGGSSDSNNFNFGIGQ